MDLKNNKKAKDMAVFALFVFPAVAFVLFATDIPLYDGRRTNISL